MKKVAIALALVSTFMISVQTVSVKATTSEVVTTQTSALPGVDNLRGSTTWRVTTNGVRFRESPGTSSIVLGILSEGEYVSSGTADDIVYKNGYYWVPVQRQSTGQWGYVASIYLEEWG